MLLSPMEDGSGLLRPGRGSLLHFVRTVGARAADGLCMLPGWTRRIARADDVALHVLYVSSASPRELNGMLVPGQSILATPHSVVTLVDELKLGSEPDVFAFVEMVVDAWHDVRDLRAGRTPRAAYAASVFDPLSLSSLRDEIGFELAEPANDLARTDSVVATLEGIVVGCDGVTLRSAREVRALAQRLLATWRVVAYLRACSDVADGAG
ncbi:hypothetical protein [Pendulispora albinea]|uniref:Uncharacterized protein n=1 Tax=Pendulispora albinea TaxID=2741071 RepID=A0ABZ2LYB3_9BACT